MAVVKEGDKVRVHYTGRLDDGTVFDSSEDSAPLEFTVGKGEVFSRIEQGIIGISPGESKTISIPMEEAYGPHREERVFEFDRKRAPENFDPVVGQPVQMYRADGLPVMATVVGISETSFIMDCNHSLAGKNLTFDITLVEIV
ncbi:MAG: FKBP-type peptidyl-prolyl cis-trans isomerase [Nitrospirae bacterium]|nr:FKBP-type peptidyl-prolyl cis-trans isomerase [Nitrospirota bacterium]